MLIRPQPQRPAEGPTMLYRSGSMEKLHGVHVDWVIVEHQEVDDYLANGWFRSPKEVLENFVLESAPAAADESEKSAAQKTKSQSK